jgi:Pyruvate/2-oxoacid:ferredoxin oxidoreductase gamma subunit
VYGAIREYPGYGTFVAAEYPLSILGAPVNASVRSNEWVDMVNEWVPNQQVHIQMGMGAQLAGAHSDGNGYPQKMLPDRHSFIIKSVAQKSFAA